jgi:predicted transcriptional regulator
VQLSFEQEAQLSRMAGQTGRTAEELACEVVERYIAKAAHFRAGVQAGLEDAARGNFVPKSEVWAAVERELQD